MQPNISRRDKERLVRHNAILDAAQAEFAEKGYGRAKLDDIAKRAEFGKGTLYNYFKGGKRGMLFAIFDKLYDDMIQLIEASFAPDVVTKSSFRDAFYDYTLSSLTFYLESKELFMILVKEAHRMCFGEDQDNASYFRQQQERVITALTEPVRRAMESGEIRSLAPRAVAHMILGNIQGIQVHMILDADDEAVNGKNIDISHTNLPPEKAAIFLTSMLLDGLGTHQPGKQKQK